MEDVLMDRTRPGVAYIEWWHVPQPRAPHIVVRETWDLTGATPVRHIHEVGEVPAELLVAYAPDEEWGS
jgi:hypothetical protein